MKHVEHWGMPLVMAIVLLIGCQKSEKVALENRAAATTVSAVVTPVSSECSTPYKIVLESVTKVGDTWEWVWSVQNPNPGNGSNGTVQDLSHWVIRLGQCATMADVIGAATSPDGITWTPFVPTYETDNAILNFCSFDTDPVLKFDLGTTGGAKSYYKLVISKNLGVDLNGIAFYKSGNVTRCGETCFPGLGCPEPEGEGCSFSQGYWFAKPNVVWPGTVTVGGHTYTQAEGMAIFASSNAGGIGTAKKVFLQVATIKLSGASVLGGATVWPYVTIGNNWLSTLPKLTPSNVKNFNNTAGAAEAKAAADAISTWIEGHHCD